MRLTTATTPTAPLCCSAGAFGFRHVPISSAADVVRPCRHGFPQAAPGRSLRKSTPRACNTLALVRKPRAAELSRFVRRLATFAVDPDSQVARSQKCRAGSQGLCPGPP